MLQGRAMASQAWNTCWRPDCMTGTTPSPTTQCMLQGRAMVSQAWHICLQACLHNQVQLYLLLPSACCGNGDGITGEKCMVSSLIASPRKGDGITRVEHMLSQCLELPAAICVTGSEMVRCLLLMRPACGSWLRPSTVHSPDCSLRGAVVHALTCVLPARRL